MGAAPSTIARKVAGDFWGRPVQTQEKIAKGIFWFSTPGHGGCVAIIGVADLSQEHVEAARKAGLVETYYVRRGATQKVIGPAGHYKDLAGWVERNDPSYGPVEVWVGEEDCAYSPILFASIAARHGVAKWHHNADGSIVAIATDEALLSTIRRWVPAFFEALGNEIARCDEPDCDAYSLDDDTTCCFKHQLERRSA